MTDRERLLRYLQREERKTWTDTIRCPLCAMAPLVRRHALADVIDWLKKHPAKPLSKARKAR